jgi:hypothetical protein
MSKQEPSKIYAGYWFDSVLILRRLRRLNEQETRLYRWWCRWSTKTCRCRSRSPWRRLYRVIVAAMQVDGPGRRRHPGASSWVISGCENWSRNWVRDMRAVKPRIRKIIWGLVPRVLAEFSDGICGTADLQRGILDPSQRRSRTWTERSSGGVIKGEAYGAHIFLYQGEARERQGGEGHQIGS